MGDFYEKYLRFGLVLGGLVILKKKFGADYEQLLKAFFLAFRGKKEFEIFLKVF